MTTVLEQIRKKYNIEKIIGQRYGEKILEFYQKNLSEIMELDDLGLQIWKFFELLWIGEKHDLILKILTTLNLVERRGLVLKRKLLDLIEEKKEKDNENQIKNQIEKQKELYYQDRDFWNFILSEHCLNTHWLDMDLGNLNDLSSARQQNDQHAFTFISEKIDDMIKN